MKNSKKPHIPPPEIVQLGDGMVAQVTKYTFEIFDEDFNPILSFDENDEEVSRCGVQGVAYVHGRCEPGYLVRDDGQNFWMIPERETFVRITEPTLMFFLEEKPSYANTIRPKDQSCAD